MGLYCQNCNRNITENFCGNCGQKKYKRIDRKYVWDEIQYTFFHTNKGFLYSIKNIIKNPGKTAREYIDGNRVNHYKPILLAFVLSGISTFISFKIVGLKEVMGAYYSKQHINAEFVNDYMTLLSSYRSIIMLFLVPFFALITKMAFKKWGHNYYEHIVMNAYVLCFYTLFNIILLDPLMFLLKKNTDVFTSLASVSIFTIPFILIWFFKGFYADKRLGSVIGRVATAIALAILACVLLVIIVAVGGYIYGLFKHG